MFPRRPTGRAAPWSAKSEAGRRSIGIASATRDAGSRIGRTITAPAADDPRPVRFAFVSCHSVNEGAQNAYRRMIWEDERAPADQRLGFVLHLGDFIYEVVEYPEEAPHRYDRTVFDIGHIPDARKVGNFCPDQSRRLSQRLSGPYPRPRRPGRARAFPVRVHRRQSEFSWQGWQSFIQYGPKVEPAQPLRVAANQAWWGCFPSRVAKASGGARSVRAAVVEMAPINTFDDDGFGDEANNRAAVGSMTAYRATIRQHVELILTDFHSYKWRNRPIGPSERPRLGRYPLHGPGKWMESSMADGTMPGASRPWRSCGRQGGA